MGGSFWMAPRFLLCVFALAAAPFAWAGSPVERYLFDRAVHVALVSRADGSGGELCWRDTVTGRTGESAFRKEGGSLLVEVAPGRFLRAHRVADAALVLERTPWAPGGGGRSLGIALD